MYNYRGGNRAVPHHDAKLKQRVNEGKCDADQAGQITWLDDDRFRPRRTPSLEKKLKPVGVFQKIKIKADLEGAGSTKRQHLIARTSRRHA
jgi:hypothetical protein